MNDPPEATDAEPKKALIHTEEAKQRQVSHWDLDYMTTAEIDAALKADTKDKSTESVDEP